MRGARLALLCGVIFLSAALEPPRCPGGGGGGSASGWSSIISTSGQCNGTQVQHPLNAGAPPGVTRAACSAWCRSQPGVGCCTSWAASAAPGDTGVCMGYSMVVPPAASPPPTPVSAQASATCTLCRTLHTTSELDSLADGGGCRALPGGNVTTSGRAACSHLCLHNPGCAWVYSPSGSFGADCTLVGECTPRGLTGGVGRIFSRACISYGPASTSAPPGASSLSTPHFLASFLVGLIVLGPPAVLYCRSKSAKVSPNAVQVVTSSDGIGRSSSSPLPTQPPSDDTTVAPGATPVSMKMVAQYDGHISKTMATQLNGQMEAHKAELLEQRLAEKRRQMQARLHAMELLLQKDKPKVDPLVAKAVAAGRRSKGQASAPSKHDELVGPEHAAASCGAGDMGDDDAGPSREP
jgi:hypothetical protein